LEIDGLAIGLRVVLRRRDESPNDNPIGNRQSTIQSAIANPIGNRQSTIQSAIGNVNHQSAIGNP
jgi:hypothetical protein